MRTLLYAMLLSLILLALPLAGGSAQADGPEVDNLPGSGPVQSEGAGVDGDSFTAAGLGCGLVD